jgi:ribosome assembly protein YihI (activator of Der GTPase)
MLFFLNMRARELNAETRRSQRRRKAHGPLSGAKLKAVLQIAKRRANRPFGIISLLERRWRP